MLIKFLAIRKQDTSEHKKCKKTAKNI